MSARRSSVSAVSERPSRRGITSSACRSSSTRTAPSSNRLWRRSRQLSRSAMHSRAWPRRRRMLQRSQPRGSCPYHLVVGVMKTMSLPAPGRQTVLGPCLCRFATSGPRPLVRPRSMSSPACGSGRNSAPTAPLTRSSISRPNASFAHAAA